MTKMIGLTVLLKTSLLIVLNHLMLVIYKIIFIMKKKLLTNWYKLRQRYFLKWGGRNGRAR